jgi:uncharacterized phage protein (TIGR02220 family)
MSAAPGGLPGTTTPTAYIPSPGLKIEKWADALVLLGGITKGMSWWIGDVLAYGEDHYGESAYQYTDLLGLKPSTLKNLMWVANSIPRSERLEALDFGHHALVASLDAEERRHWLAMAVQGEMLPNGERKRWSVEQFKEKLRALPAGAATVRTEQAADSVATQPTDPILDEDEDPPEGVAPTSREWQLAVLLRKCRGMETLDLARTIIGWFREQDEAPPREKIARKVGTKTAAKALLAFLNEKTGHSYQPTAGNLALIVGRLEEGYTEEQCRAVIARQVREWGKKDEMKQYLRPATLFNRTKFGQYAGQLPRTAFDHGQEQLQD